MIFELPDATDCTLDTMTNRVEKHGDDDVPAVSFGLKCEAANTILDRISTTLRGAIYTKHNDQPQLDGIEAVTPNLRSKDIEVVTVAGCFAGWTLTVDHGINEHEPISFGGCKVDKFKVEPKEGGTVELSLRIGTSDIDAERLGIIGMKLGQNISIRLIAPENAERNPTT